MELALGQFHRCGCLTIWDRICPALKGEFSPSFSDQPCDLVLVRNLPQNRDFAANAAVARKNSSLFNRIHFFRQDATQERKLFSVT